MHGVALSGLGYIFENGEMAEGGKVSEKLQQTIIKVYAIYIVKPFHRDDRA